MTNSMGSSALLVFLLWLVICSVFKATDCKESSVSAGIQKLKKKTWTYKDSLKPNNLTANVQLPLSLLTAWKSLKNTSKLHNVKKTSDKQTQGAVYHGQKMSSFSRLKLKKLLAVTKTSTKKSEQASQGCSTKIDLGFIMGGCGTESFQPCTSFAKTLISKLSEYKVDGHFGLILFSKRAKIIINFEDNQEQAEVVRELSAIKYRENAKVSKLKMGKALQLAKDLFTNARKDSEKIAIVVTGGRASDDVVVPSQELKTSGVSIFGMGLGSEVEKTQLGIIASTPSNEFVYSLNPDDVSALTNRIITGFCKGPKTATFTFIMDEGNESQHSKDYKSKDLNSHQVNEYSSVQPEDGNEDPSAYLKFLAGLNQALPPWTDNNVDSWQAMIKESNKNTNKEDNDEAIMRSPDDYEHLVNSDADFNNDTPQGRPQDNVLTNQEKAGLDIEKNPGSVLLTLSNNTLILPLSVENSTSGKESKKAPSLDDITKVLQNDAQEGNGNVDTSNGGSTLSSNAGAGSTSQNGINGENSGNQNGNNNAMNSGNNQGMNIGNNQGMNNGNNQGMNGNNQGMNGNNQGINNGNNQGMNNGNNQGMNNGNNQGM
ncbi:homeobox protein 2-like, partial [Actinia tenebrosa]|uniref:Homeobox protein 2-like n=1 Tax=Actinia tenebrosa TaxID=6105 RepID=A0A6P8IF39_ACTTE